MDLRSLRSFPLAYHLSIQAYGSWLPGDPRGWHNRGDGAKTPPRPGNAALRAVARERQRHPSVSITDRMAAVIVESTASTSLARGWTLHIAVAVHSHLHVVVSAASPGVTVIDQIRTATTRSLVDRGLHDPAGRFWSAGGYFTVIRTARQLERAVEYVRRHRAPGDSEDGD